VVWGRLVKEEVLLVVVVVEDGGVGHGYVQRDLLLYCRWYLSEDVAGCSVVGDRVKSERRISGEQSVERCWREPAKLLSSV
jgi:hypothetical protein